MAILAPSRVLHRLFIPVLLALGGIACSAPALADPPSRVVRVSYLGGAVSFSPAGEDEWVQAFVNRPLVTGDRLWADDGGRAELHLGSTALHVGADTSVSLLNLDDGIAQFNLAQGTLDVHVRRVDPDRVVEIDTPNLALTLTQPGDYRIDVDPEGTWTAVTLRRGQGEVFGDGNGFILSEGMSYRFYGSDPSDYESYLLPDPDEFDRWASQRDRRWEASASARYVSPEMIGYEDLDDYGQWRVVADYGPVWVPQHVPAGWAPYREGHWTWVEPWGWTWIDDAPWGFAPSHYGRWTRLGDAWGWVPGPVASRPVYAPAVVQFVGGGGSAALTLGGVAAVAWFALAPHEVYRPAYEVSPTYLQTINSSNTVVNTTTITNITRTTNVTNVVYVNQQVAGAVVAVPTATFAESKPVARAALVVSKEAATHASAVAMAPVAPQRTSLVGTAAPASVKPPAALAARTVVAKATPPAPQVPFAARQQALAAHPGQPLAPAAVAQLRPATPPHAAPAVHVVAAAPARATALPPPKAAPAGSAARGAMPAPRPAPQAQAAAPQKPPAPATGRPVPPPPVSTKPETAPAAPKPVAPPPKAEPAEVAPKPVAPPPKPEAAAVAPKPVAPAPKPEAAAVAPKPAEPPKPEPHETRPPPVPEHAPPPARAEPAHPEAAKPPASATVAHPQAHAPDEASPRPAPPHVPASAPRGEGKPPAEH